MQDTVRALHREALEYLCVNYPDMPPYPHHLVWGDPVRFEVKAKVPTARVSCHPQGMIWLWGGNLTVAFPRIHDFVYRQVERPILPEMKNVDILESVQRNLASRGILNDSSTVLHEEIFGQGQRALIIPVENKSTGNSLDLAILLGVTWNATISDELKPPSNVLACSIDARWTGGKISWK
ncbi:hypothetical protein ACJZ2D_011529 [Fusarium nematophilum]